MAQNLNKKISSGIVQTVAKYCTSSRRTALRRNVRTPYHVCKTSTQSTNLVKYAETGLNCSHLQPSKMPVLCENRLEINNGEDIEKDKFNSIKQIGCTLVETIQRVPAVVQPFPDPYISSKVYTSLNEHARKLKSKSLVQGKLHSLTVPFNIRQFSSKSSVPVSKKECIVKEPICKKKKECRKIPRKCPNFVLPDCECRVVSICEHPYKGKPCTKQAAPYPSYSEACAEELNPGFSECVRCPWKRCPVDTKNKGRNFHMSVRNFSLDHTAITRPKKLTLISEEEFMKFGGLNCDARKKPCEAPPPKCPPPEGKKKHKPKHPPYKQKQKSNKCKIECDGQWHDLCSIVMKKNENFLQLLPPGKFELKNKNKKIEKFPYNANEADYDHKRKRKCQVERCPKKSWWPSVPGCEKTPQCPCKKAAEIVNEKLWLANEVDGPCPGHSEGAKVPDLDRTIDIRYRPIPCCPHKSGIMKKKYRKPRVFVPTPIDYNKENI